MNSRILSIWSWSAPPMKKTNWAYAERSIARREMSPPAWNSRLKAKVLDLAMIVLSRSKKAAGGAGHAAIVGARPTAPDALARCSGRPQVSTGDAGTSLSTSAVGPRADGRRWRRGRSGHARPPPHPVRRPSTTLSSRSVRRRGSGPRSVPSRRSPWQRGAAATWCWSVTTSPARSSASHRSADGCPRRSGSMSGRRRLPRRRRAWAPTSVVDLPSGRGLAVRRAWPTSASGPHPAGWSGWWAGQVAREPRRWRARSPSGTRRARTDPAVDADPLGPGLDRLLGMEDRRRRAVGGPRRAPPAGRVAGSARGSAPARRAGRPHVVRPATAARRGDRAAGPGGRGARGHDLVVVDLARQGGALLAELVDRCDDLLVVTPATVPGLAAAARLVADLGRDGRAGLVLRPGGVSDADAERVTGLPVVAAVPTSAVWPRRSTAASARWPRGPLAGRRRPAGDAA